MNARQQRGRAAKRWHHAQAACDRWNAQHAVGTIVDYRSTPEAPPLRTATRSPAQTLCDTAVVWLEHKAGAVALDHCTPADPAETPPGPIDAIQITMGLEVQRRGHIREQWHLCRILLPAADPERVLEEMRLRAAAHIADLRAAAKSPAAPAAAETRCIYCEHAIAADELPPARCPRCGGSKWEMKPGRQTDH